MQILTKPGDVRRAWRIRCAHLKVDYLSESIVCNAIEGSSTNLEPVFRQCRPKGALNAVEFFDKR
jgi:hypothetical protein